MLSGKSSWKGCCETMVPDHQASSTTHRKRSATFHWRLIAKSYIWRKTRKSTTSARMEKDKTNIPNFIYESTDWHWLMYKTKVTITLNDSPFNAFISWYLSVKDPSPKWQYKRLTVHVVIFDSEVLPARVTILIDWLETEQDESWTLRNFAHGIRSLHLVNLVFDPDNLDQLVFSVQRRRELHSRMQVSWRAVGGLFT